MLRNSLLTLVALAFAPAASAIPIGHICLFGTYYQVSPTQDKVVEMGTCSGGPWIYVAESDVLLLTSPATPAPDTIKRYANAAPTGSLAMSEFQARLSRARTLERIRPVLPPGPMAASVAARYPTPKCKEDEYPPCHGGCWGMPPQLCDTVRRIPGSIVAVKAAFNGSRSGVKPQTRTGELQQQK